MTPHAPLLAADLRKNGFDFSKVPYPVLATPKIDGIRCLTMLKDGKKQVLSRAFKAIPNHHIYAKLLTECPLGLDGELIVPGAPFGTISSTVMSHQSPLQVDFEYLVFDTLSDKPYRERMADLLAMPLPTFCQKLIPTQLEDAEALAKYEGRCLANGFEGVMLRSPHGPYVTSHSKTNRSTLKKFDLVKVKRRLQDEAEIVGFGAQMHNMNYAEQDEFGLTKRSHSMSGRVSTDMLGFYVVKHPRFGEFKVGTGYSHRERINLWRTRQDSIGRIISFKYLSHGMKDKPRHPVFVGFRHGDDM